MVIAAIIAVLFRIVMFSVLLLLLGNHSAGKKNRLDAIFEPEPGVLVPFRSRQDRTPARIRSVLRRRQAAQDGRSEEHTSELQSLMRISYAVFCLKKKISYHNLHHTTHQYSLYFYITI